MEPSLKSVDIKIEIKEEMPKCEPVPITFDTIQSTQIKYECTDSNDSAGYGTIYKIDQVSGISERNNEEEDQLMQSHSPAVSTNTSSAGNSEHRTQTRDKHLSCDTKKFTQKWGFKKHLLTHTGKKPFPCDVCAHKFTENWNLKKHLLTHTGQPPFSCDIYGRTYTQMGHLKSHDETDERQHIIATRRSSSKNVAKELQIVHNGTESTSVMKSATGCKRTTVKRKTSDSEVPVRRSRGRPPKNAHASTSAGAYSRPSRQRTSSYCSDSTDSYKRVSLSSVESDSDKYRELRYKNNEASKKSRQNRKAREREMLETCTKLEKENEALRIREEEMRKLVDRLREEWWFKKHLLTHTGKKPFPCGVCAHKFTENWNLKKHLLTHTGQPPFSCDIYGRTFTQMGHLKSHDETDERQHIIATRRSSSKKVAKELQIVHNGTGSTSVIKSATGGKRNAAKRNASDSEVPVQRSRGHPPKNSQASTSAGAYSRPSRQRTSSYSSDSTDSYKRVRLSSVESESDKYRELRYKNNEASKKSRQNRKAREREMLETCTKLEKENEALRIREEEMRKLVGRLREAMIKAVAKGK